jgi:hypothetical protein
MSGLALILALSVPSLEYEFNEGRQELTIQVKDSLISALVGGETLVSVLPVSDHGVQLITVAGVPVPEGTAPVISSLKEMIELGANGEIALELSDDELLFLRRGGELHFRILNENRQARRFAFWLKPESAAGSVAPPLVRESVENLATNSSRYSVGGIDDRTAPIVPAAGDVAAYTPRPVNSPIGSYSTTPYFGADGVQDNHSTQPNITSTPPSTTARGTLAATVVNDPRTIDARTVAPRTNDPTTNDQRAIAPGTYDPSIIVPRTGIASIANSDIQVPRYGTLVGAGESTALTAPPSTATAGLRSSAIPPLGDVPTTTPSTWRSVGGTSVPTPPDDRRHVVPTGPSLASPPRFDQYGNLLADPVNPLNHRILAAPNYSGTNDAYAIRRQEGYTIPTNSNDGVVPRSVPETRPRYTPGSVTPSSFATLPTTSSGGQFFVQRDHPLAVDHSQGTHRPSIGSRVENRPVTTIQPTATGIENANDLGPEVQTASLNADNVTNGSTSRSATPVAEPKVTTRSNDQTERLERIDAKIATTSPPSGAGTSGYAVACAFLIASNIGLLWIVFTYLSRYRSLLQQMRERGSLLT